MLAYLEARAADGDGAGELAAKRYATALAAAPGNTIIAAYAYRQAVEAGDLALADKAAATLTAAGQAPADAALLAIAAAARAHEVAAADLAIGQLERGQLAILAPALKAWAAFERGNDPLPALTIKSGDIVARRFADEARALILLAQGKTDEGLTALRVLLGNDQPSEDLRIAAARLLIGTGRTDAAKTLLVGDAAAITTLRGRPGQGVAPSLAFGAAVLFARVASDLALGPPGPLSITLAQAAIRADPSNDRARLLLANALSRGGATDRALALLAEVDPAGPYAPAAAGGRVQVLADAGRSDAAIAAARALVAPTDARPADIQRLAELLIAADRPAVAVPVYRRLLDRAGDAADWSDWLQYGAALDQAGDWRRARPALERAVALSPAQPIALNYLGYASIEHGENLIAAQAMLEQASRLKPEDAAITDSLGWAYHLRGDSQRALPLLERAAAAAPDNAEIGEHLGDVYWSRGRRYEARYAWTAARLVSSPAEAARLAEKIANGPIPAR